MWAAHPWWVSRVAQGLRPRMHQDSNSIQMSSILKAFSLTRNVGLCNVCDVIRVDAYNWMCERCVSCLVICLLHVEMLHQKKEMLKCWYEGAHKRNVLFLSMSDKQKHRTYIQTKGRHWGGEQKGRRGKRTHGGRSKGNSRELETWQNLKAATTMLCVFFFSRS